MKGLSQKSKYALRALQVLARERGRGPVLAGDLAKREDIPHKFLELILLTLKNHGLLTVGATIADAFLYMFNLQRACEIQIAAQASGARMTTSNTSHQMSFSKECTNDIKAISLPVSLWVADCPLSITPCPLLCRKRSFSLHSNGQGVMDKGQ